MKRELIAMALIASVSQYSWGQACTMMFASQFPHTQIALGPNAYAAIVNTPGVAEAILNARDVWDSTDARDRLGDWNGVVTASDCPSDNNPLQYQLGALAFSGSNCITLGTLKDPGRTLAFVDYYITSPCYYRCGTKSITVNLNYAWSVAGEPLPSEVDLQSILAHEFGHVLGLQHMYNGQCNPNSPTYPSCAVNPNRETMTPSFHAGPGETCGRTLTPNDINSANGFY